MTQLHRLLMIGLLALPAAAYSQELGHARAALAMGDTAFALELLRKEVTTKSDPVDQCLLASVIARTVTKRFEDWKARTEAKDWFERALRARNEPLCVLEYAGLMERQGIRVDAERLAKRAFRMINADSMLHTPPVLAEVYYRRALGLAEWVRQFDHFVFVPDLPVATPSCGVLGAFCLSIVQPAEFRERLWQASMTEDLVGDKRAVVRALLDTALSHDPAHSGALRLALRDAAMTGEWNRFRELAVRARRADVDNVGHLLGVLAGDVFGDRGPQAAAVFDTIMERLGPDAMARYEGLALVADTSLRDRLKDQDRVVYGEAIWGLSDPLYLTAANERRIAHYARIVVADVWFSDPAAGVAGRDTPQGRLLIRYGIPAERYSVHADRRLVQGLQERAELRESLACASQAMRMGRPEATKDEPACGAVTSQVEGGGGGRWEFWYYAPNGPPFVFERSLMGGVARHMFETKSRELDSLLHRAIPSSFESPFRGAEAKMLVTVFPRPDSPAVEIWARFAKAQTGRTARRTELGIFVHDRTSGRLVAQRRWSEPSGVPSHLFRYQPRLPWGRFRIAAEGVTPDSAAGQARASVDLEPTAPGKLKLSGLLLGDSAVSPAAPLRNRADVSLRGRSDSVCAPGAPLALYWEVYGLAPRSDGSAAGALHYRVRLALHDAENRPLLASAVRALGRLLGIRDETSSRLEWVVERPATGSITPEVLNVMLPDAEGLVRVRVTVEDLVTGQVAIAERIVRLTP